MIPATCPSPEELTSFNAGTLESALRVEELAVHLETCAACLAIVQSRPVDTCWGRMTLDDERTRAEFLREPQFQTALARIAAIPQQIDVDTTPLRIGEYEVVERLGAGGMGTVYKSWHARLQRPVVLKLIRARSSHQTAAIEQFREEMSALGRLDHPLVVKAYDAQEFQGLEYLVMEYVAGSNLRELVLRDGPFQPADACAVVHEIALGLEHLHERQIVHRDIKPSNIALSDDGHVKILDLGLALSLGISELSSAPPGHVEGTLDFMAPEQAIQGRAITPAADLHALGATLYFLLVGESPLSEYRDREAKLRALQAATPRDLKKLPKQLPRRVRNCLERLLAHHPEDRPAAAREVAEVLRPFARASRRVLLTQDRLSHSSARWPRPIAMLGAVALLLLTAAIPLGRMLWPTPQPESPSSTVEFSAGQPPPVSPSSRDIADRIVDPSTSAPPSESPDRAGQRPRYVPWRGGSSSQQLIGLASSPPLFDGIARWQVETVRPRGFVQALAISPDARHFALASQEGAVRIFARGTAPNAAQLVRLLPQEGPENHAARSLAWSPDGRWLAVAIADGDRPIAVWDWQAAVRVLELRGHATGIVSLAWNPVDQTLASAGQDGRVRIWDTAGLVQRTIEAGPAPCTSLTWRPDGKSFVVGDRLGGVSQWSVEGQSVSPRVVYPGGKILSVEWQPQGKELAIVTADHVLHVHDPSHSESPSKGTHISMPFRALVWAGNGEWLDVVTDGGPLRWDRERLEFTAIESGPRIATAWVAGAWVRETNSMWLSSAEGKVREISSSGIVTEILEMPHVYLRDLVWNRDSTRLAVCSVDGGIQLWGGQGRPYGSLAGREPIPAGLRCAAWSGDGRYLAAAELAPRSLVHIWEIESRAEIATWSFDAPVESLAWSDDAQWVLAVGAAGRIRTWDVRAQRAGPSPTLHTSTIHCVATCPHTRRFASGDSQGTIQVWELDASDEVHVVATWPGQREPAWSLAWNPAGDRLGVTGVGSQAWMLDAATGREVWSIQCPIPPGRIAWKQDGQRVYVNGGGVRDARDGALLITALYPEPAAYSPDGRWIAEVSPTQLVTVRHAGNQAPNWRGVPLGKDRHVTFAPTGQIIYQSHPYEEQLAYVVEPRRGEVSTLRPSAFEQRVQRRISK